MTSKRELILQSIGNILSSVAAVSGRVYRSRADALVRDQAPCVTYDWANEEALPQSTVLAERQIDIFVSVFVRGDEPDKLADPIVCDIHSAIMADTSLGGLAIDISLGPASFEYESADKTAGKMTHEYQVMFRHAYADMTV